MSVLGLAGCLFNRHAPERREVRWDGQAYIGECRHCGARIERVARRDWRRRPDKAEARKGIAD